MTKIFTFILFFLSVNLFSQTEKDTLYILPVVINQIDTLDCEWAIIENKSIKRLKDIRVYCRYEMQYLEDNFCTRHLMSITDIVYFRTMDNKEIPLNIIAYKEFNKNPKFPKNEYHNKRKQFR